MQLCQFDALHQSGLVMEYLEQFEQLSHAIPLYNSYYDDTYFVVRFLGGLKEEFRTAISLHQPKDIQTASTLALMQEEEPAHSSRRALPRDSGKFSFRSMTQFDKSKTSTSDKSKKSRGCSSKLDRPTADDKLKALLAYRKKHGFYYKGGETWGHNHKCPQ